METRLYIHVAYIKLYDYLKFHFLYSISLPLTTFVYACKPQDTPLPPQSGPVWLRAHGFTLEVGDTGQNGFNPIPISVMPLIITALFSYVVTRVHSTSLRH